MSGASANRVDGAALYGLVEAYADFGWHRTGSEVDNQTAAWIADALRRLGLDVAMTPVPFDRWTGSSSVNVDGVDIEHLAVPYEFTGSVDTTDVHVAEIDPNWGGDPAGLAGPVAEARACGADAVVLATTHPEGALVASNRDLTLERSGFPTVLVAGREFNRCAAGDVRLRVDGELTAGNTTNVIGHNAVAGEPLVLTTPLTGWFGCAGERGTGIAVLLHLVDALADLPLLVVATGGHELTWFGADVWVDTAPPPAAAIVHVGASVAVVEPGTGSERALAATRLARTSVSSADAPAMASTLAPARLDLQYDSSSWKGEAQTFCRLGLPLLSFAGAGRDFHCPEDTPERATTPQALATVATAIAEAARQLYATTTT